MAEPAGFVVNAESGSRTPPIRFPRKRKHVGRLRLEPGDRRLKYLQQPLIEQRNAGRRI
jgi:hypothetical protein